MTLNATQLSALSRLFSSSVFRELAHKGYSSLFARLYIQTGLLDRNISNNVTVAETFDRIFNILSQSGVRNEYIYRAAITHNILLGRHSLNTASMLSEFRSGTSKADLVILNGTSTVYEIKSDRDTLSRLNSQLSNYRKVFGKIYVIAGQAHIDEVSRSTPNDVGILSLIKTNQIHKVREAVDISENVCPVTIFDSLRIDEARTILKNLNQPIPVVPNTILRSSMRESFSSLKPSDVHNQMVKTLKQSRNLAPLVNFIDQLPKSLQPAGLSTQIHKSEYDQLIRALSTPLDTALDWAYK